MGVNETDTTLARIALASAEDARRRLGERLAAVGIAAWRVPFTIAAADRRIADAREHLETLESGPQGLAAAKLASSLERAFALGDQHVRVLRGEPEGREETAALCLGIQLLLGQALKDEHELIGTF